MFKVTIQNSNHLLMNSRPLKYVLLISLHSISLLNLIWKGYFRFPFYGHEVDKVYVTTGGFLSLSSRIHGFIYKIQYIAPLRLKLDPSLSEESEISYKLTEILLLNGSAWDFQMLRVKGREKQLFRYVISWKFYRDI